MKLQYYRDNSGNFGDDLNPWLWPRLLPDYFDGRADTLFLGIGTLLNSRIPREPGKVVLGTGAGYGDPPELDDRWRFHCVRGPLTAERLGLPADLAVTDAAYLTRLAYDPFRAQRRHVSFMPHHFGTADFDWRALSRRAGLKYLDPAASVASLLAGIAGSRFVIAEAMHAAIIADAFRVPWIPLAMYQRISAFKWDDWCRSVELAYDPVRIEPLHDNSSQRPLRRLRGYVRRVWRTRSPTRYGRNPDREESPPHLVEQVLDQLSGLRTRGAEALLSSDAVLSDRMARLTLALRQVR
jgi:succinoglycan biosynthesis protein ExoV